MNINGSPSVGGGLRSSENSEGVQRWESQPDERHARWVLARIAIMSNVNTPRSDYIPENVGDLHTGCTVYQRYLAMSSRYWTTYESDTEPRDRTIICSRSYWKTLLP